MARYNNGITEGSPTTQYMSIFLGIQSLTGPSDSFSCFPVLSTEYALFNQSGHSGLSVSVIPIILTFNLLYRLRNGGDRQPSMQNPLSVLPGSFGQLA